MCCLNDADVTNCPGLFSEEKTSKGGRDPAILPKWMCSKSYKTSLYSLYMCPYHRDPCGPNKIIEFSNEGEDGAIHIRGLMKGETCVYNVEARCGAPSLKVHNATGVSVFY